jgi:hypothetical protein
MKLKLSDAQSIYSLSGRSSEDYSGDCFDYFEQPKINLNSDIKTCANDNYGDNFNRKNSLEDDLRESMPSVI